MKDLKRVFKESPEKYRGEVGLVARVSNAMDLANRQLSRFDKFMKTPG